MSEDIEKFSNRNYGFFSGFIVACILIGVISACSSEWAIGKDIREIEEELSKEMFVVDSLIADIKIMLGDTSIIQIEKK